MKVFQAKDGLYLNITKYISFGFERYSIDHVVSLNNATTLSAAEERIIRHALPELLDKYIGRSVSVTRIVTLEE